MADDGAYDGMGGGSWLPAVLSVILRFCRLLVVVPIVVLALSSLAAFLDTCYVLASVVAGVIQAPNDTAKFSIGLVKVIDLVLIGVVLFIVAVGLEELFLGSVSSQRPGWVPRWLVVHDLNGLKELVLSTLVLVVVVTFVDTVVSSQANLQVLELGGAAGAIVVAIAIYLRLAGSSR